MATTTVNFAVASNKAATVDKVAVANAAAATICGGGGDEGGGGSGKRGDDKCGK